MKKLGLVGGIGPESSVIYYREILRAVRERMGSFPNLTIESLSCFDVFDFCAKDDLAGLVAYVGRGIKNLVVAGADFVALCGNTPNIVFDELQANSPVPIVSAVACSADYAFKNGLRKLILLGTKATMKADFFQKIFTPKGLQIFTPSDAEIELIAYKIESEIELGIVKKETRAEILNIVNRLKIAHGVDGVILGCTELPILFEGHKFDISCLDTMRIHIKTLAQIIITEENL